MSVRTKVRIAKLEICPCAKAGKNTGRKAGGKDLRGEEIWGRTEAIENRRVGSDLTPRWVAIDRFKIQCLYQVDGLRRLQPAPHA
jgi:hypothetical protein